MNRRTFTKVSALAAAASQLPRLSMGQRPAGGAGQKSAGGAGQRPAGGRRLGFAAVGLGGISEIFMRACAASQSARITALVTGHPKEKGERYAAMYGIPRSSIYTYAEYERLAENRDVDAVYIGLPNSMHCEYTVRAAAAGKQVLCEKPMAISSAECRRMIDACAKAKVKLMIAYRVQYDPTWIEGIQRIRDGWIGELESFQGGFFNQQPEGVWRLNRRLGGGGSLLDVGIYPLNAIRHITGEEPAAYTAVAATRDHSGRFAEVEQSLEWTMKMPSGILASCGCSYGQDGPSFLTINGDKGFLQFEPAFLYDGVHLTGRAGGETVDLRGTGKMPFQFAIEADSFARCVWEDRQPEADGEEGLKDLMAIEAIYRAAGTPIA